MSKNIYVGVSSVARKITKEYVGVGDVARKVTKGYIGVNGVAQQFYSAGVLVGSPAIAGSTNFGSGLTLINKQYPANKSGTISAVQIFVYSAMSGCVVATFYSTGTNKFTARAYTTIGGSGGTNLKTFSVSLPVQAGDYIGIYYTGGGIEANEATGEGVWYLSGNQTQCVNTVFDFDGSVNAAMSLRGTGA